MAFAFSDVAERPHVSIQFRGKEVRAYPLSANDAAALRRGVPAPVVPTIVELGTNVRTPNPSDPQYILDSAEWRARFAAAEVAATLDYETSKGRSWSKVRAGDDGLRSSYLNEAAGELCAHLSLSQLGELLDAVDAAAREAGKAAAKN